MHNDGNVWLCQVCARSEEVISLLDVQVIDEDNFLQLGPPPAEVMSSDDSDHSGAGMDVVVGS